MTDDRLWTVTEACRYLVVSRSTLYILPIKYAKIGGQRRYDPAEVRLFVMLNEHRTTRATA